MTDKEKDIKTNIQSEIIIYQTADGSTKIDVKFQDETVWLTQAQLCELYQTSKSNISEHIKHIFEEGELEEDSVVRKFRTTGADGKNYNIAHYNLDMIISLGYRVKSLIATQFRRWATERLKEYMIKGFTMDDERLKNLGGGNYWKELLDRIRDIRSSEKVMYRQVLDLYATSVDYNSQSSESIAFFKMVQNKLHYAAHGHTAAEVIYERADAEQPFMGLKTFSGDFPTLKDIGMAKNYLNEEELKILNNIVSGYFDFAEIQAIRHNPMYMPDYVEHLDNVLKATGEKLLQGAGTIRNFILMGLPAKEQNEYYEKYWNHIEECTRYDVSSFVRDYLSVKRLAIPSQKKIYIDFKEYVELASLGAEDLLKDLLTYAKRYEILLNGGTGYKALDACINRLNRLETTVTRPFFLEALRLHNEGKLDVSQITDVFLITENYLFRRTACNLPTNALNKLFLMLHREIMRYDGTDAEYVEKFKYALLSKKDRARFLDNDEFAIWFTERQVYQMNSKNKIYILERLENYGTAEDKDVYGHCDDGVYSIEHIMPQHLTPAWVNTLGDDYEQIHETWLHRIANLTLTAYNSKYSNSAFEEKKTMKNGFEDSGIRMNTYIAKKEKWSLAELEERNQYLMERALKIWAAPSTEFKPEEKQFDTCTLDDDTNLSGRQIARFSYLLRALRLAMAFTCGQTQTHRASCPY